MQELKKTRETVSIVHQPSRAHRSPSPVQGWKPLKNRHFIMLVNGFPVSPFQPSPFPNQLGSEIVFSLFSLHGFPGPIKMKVSQLYNHEGETVHRFQVSPSGSPSRFPAFTPSSFQAGETFPGFPVFLVKAGKGFTLETVTGWKPIKETVRKGDLEMLEYKKTVKPVLTFPAFTVSPFTFHQPSPFTLSSLQAHPHRFTFQPSPSGSPSPLHLSPSAEMK